MDPVLDRVARALHGRYRFEQELGRGGMATVYLATDLRLGREVAIKVLPPRIHDSLGPDRFQREVQLAAQLSHPHIVPLFEAGEADGILFYAMGYVAGESLATRLAREGPLPLEDALRITAEVGDALGYAHERDIVHRDVKPANVLLTRGHALVADFGIAKHLATASDGSLTATGIAIGTAEYMSPEQAAGDTRVDARTDVYGLAAVLYEMLTGEPPFTGRSVQAIIARVLAEVPRPVRTIRRGVPAHIEKALLTALAKSPADRPPTVRAFVDALTLRNRRSTSPLRVGAAAAAILGIAALGWLVWHARGHETTGDLSVGVLYFDNLSPDSSDAYLADGLTEEIASRLGDVRRLLVKQVSREGVRQLRETAPDYRITIGREMAVRHIVEGSVRRAAGRVRVVARLVDTKTGFRSWGQTYERPAEDLLSLEDDVAKEVATAIAGELAPGERTALSDRPTASPDAHEHFLRGNYYLAKRSASALSRSIEEYEAAQALDPKFTRALARVAYAYGLSVRYGWLPSGSSRDSMVQRAAAISQRAIRQDSTLSDAWLAWGFALTLLKPRDFGPSFAAFERALTLDPRNSEALGAYGGNLRVVGRDSAARAAIQRSLMIEPARPVTLHSRALLELYQRRYDDARRWVDSSLHVNPEFFLAYLTRARVRLFMKDTPGAQADAESALRLGNDSTLGQALLVMVEMQGRDTTAVRVHLRRMKAGLAAMISGLHEQVGEEGVLPAAALLAVGDRAGALSFLESVQPKGLRFWYGLRAPEFDPLRSDPRFERLAQASRPTEKPQ
jgi:serine/threonine protein kinase